MARDKNLIVVSADGRAYKADLGATAPTNATTVPAAFQAGDLGWCHEDGLSVDISEDRQNFGAWGNLGPVRTQVTKRTRTFKITALESSPFVMALYDSVPTPTPDGSGAFDYAISDAPDQDLGAWIFDTLNSGRIIRYYAANAEITGRESIVHNSTPMTAYTFTIQAYPDDSSVSLHKFVVQPSLAT